MPLPTELLELLADTREVLIETRSGEDVTKTVIWVGVSDDMVYVRSVRGESGRWYQRAIASDDVTLIIGEFRLELRAEPVCSHATWGVWLSDVTESRKRGIGVCGGGAFSHPR